MTTVVLAEKPDQGRKFANALGKTQNKDGHIKVDSDLFNQKVVVTWGIGHLVGLSTPDKYDEKYKKWSFDHLPILPDQMKYEVNLKTSKQFKIVKQLLQQASEIIIATDPDREGENIAYSIFKLSGKDVWQKPKKDYGSIHYKKMRLYEASNI